MITAPASSNATLGRNAEKTDPICWFELVSSLFPRRVLASPWEGDSPGDQPRLENREPGCLWDEFDKLYNWKLDRTPCFSGGWDRVVSSQRSRARAFFNKTKTRIHIFWEGRIWKWGTSGTEEGKGKEQLQVEAS